MMKPALTKNLKHGTVTIRYGYEQFLLSAKIKNYSPATIAYYERHIALFDKFHSLDNPITTITPELVQNYTLHLIEKDLREYSVFSYLKALRTVVNFFIRNDYIPQFHFEMPRYQEEIKEIYSDEELVSYPQNGYEKINPLNTLIRDERCERKILKVIYCFLLV